jgi:ABC-type multidrug transport system fused ATPase/permease subunit
MESKKKKFLYSIITVILALTIFFSVLYYLFWSILIDTIFSSEGLWIGVVAIIGRTLILGIMSFFLYRKWLRQEAIYISDAYFLFGSFFGILTCAKIYDLFFNLVVISGEFSTEFSLLLVKIRFFIIIVNLIPILYIGLDAILIYINMNKNKEMNKKQFNKLRLRIMFGFVLVTALVIVLSPTLNFLNLAFPFITILIYVAIAFMFLFMYKNKRLVQANGLIIGIAFICFIVSNMLRTVLVNANPLYSIFSELIDIGVNLFMFVGFISKPKYA